MAFQFPTRAFGLRKESSHCQLIPSKIEFLVHGIMGWFFNIDQKLYNFPESTPSHSVQGDGLGEHRCLLSLVAGKTSCADASLFLFQRLREKPQLASHFAHLKMSFLLHRPRTGKEIGIINEP